MMMSCRVSDWKWEIFTSELLDLNSSVCALRPQEPAGGQAGGDVLQDHQHPEDPPNEPKQK